MPEQRPQTPVIGGPALREGGILTLLLAANTMAFAPEVMMCALYPALATRFGLPLDRVVLLSTPRALAQLGVLALGPLSDRVGRAALLVGGLFLVAGAGWGGAVAPHLAAMAAVQVAMGLGLAIANAGIPALVGDRYAYAIRGRVVAITRLSVPLALIVVVPALVALAAQRGAVAPFVALGAMATAIGLLAAWQLPRAAGRHSLPAAGAAARREDWARPRVFLALGLALCLAMVPAAVFGFLPAWVGDTFGDPGRTVGLAIAADGVGALAGIGLSALLVDRLTKRRALVAGLALAGVSALLLPGTGHAFGLALAAVAGLSASLELSFVAFTAFLSELAPRARGTIFSLWAAALALGGSLSPFLARLLWLHRGMAGIGWAGGALLLAIAAILAVAAVEPEARALAADGA